MISKRLLHLAQLSAVGLTGYFIGQHDKYFKNEDKLVNGKTLTTLPGLPIFGTVSAATPYTESGGARDRVCFILYKSNIPALICMYVCHCLIPNLKKRIKYNKSLIYSSETHIEPIFCSAYNFNKDFKSK